MAIAHDTQTRFPASGTESTGGNRTFSHTPVGTPVGVVVLICGVGTAALASSVTYGTASLSLLQSATVTTGGGAEANQRVECWASVTDIPSGQQTVTMNSMPATAHGAVCATVTAATGTAAINTSGTTALTTSTNPRQSLTTSADTMAYAAITSDANSVLSSMLAGCTNLVTGWDWGSQVAGAARRTNVTSASTFDTGFSYATSDQWCAVGVAFAEAANPNALATPDVVTCTTSIPAPESITGIPSISIDSSSPAAVKNEGSTSATAVTASFSPPANSRVVVAVNLGYAAQYGSSVTVSCEDSLSNPYTAGPYTWCPQDGSYGGRDGSYIFSHYYSTAPGSITVTATRSNTNKSLFHLVVIVLKNTDPTQSGAGSNSYYDNTLPGSINIYSSITTTTTNSWTLVAASMNSSEAVLYEVNDTTYDQDNYDITDGVAAAVGYAVTTSPGSTTMGWTIGGGGDNFSWAALEILPTGGSGDATATPAVVSISTDLPAPTLSTSVLVVTDHYYSDTYSDIYHDSTIHSTTSIPTPTVTTGGDSATAIPAVVSASVTIPAPSLAALVKPAVVPIAITVPTPVLASLAKPGVIACTVSVPSPTPSASSKATPAVIAATTQIQTITFKSDAKPAPSVVAGTTVIPAVQFQSNVLILPSVVTAITAVPSPTITHTALTTPSVIATQASIPVPTVTAGGSATATPAVVSATITIPTPALASLAKPGVVSATVSVPAPSLNSLAKPVGIAVTTQVQSVSIVTTARATPSVIAGTSSIQAPGILASGKATPAVVNATAAIPTPTIVVSGSATVTPATVQVLTSVGTANVAPARAAVVSATVSIPTPTVTTQSNATATPPVVSVTTAVGSPVIRLGAIVSAPAVLASTSLYAPAMAISGLATPACVMATATVPTTLASVSMTAQPATIDAVINILNPEIQSEVIISATVLSVLVNLPVPYVPNQFGFGIAGVSGQNLNSEVSGGPLDYSDIFVGEAPHSKVKGHGK